MRVDSVPRPAAGEDGLRSRVQHGGGLQGQRLLLRLPRVRTAGYEVFFLHPVPAGRVHTRREGAGERARSDGASLVAGHNSDGKFIARAQRIEFDCETIPRRVAIFIEKSKDGQVMPVPNVVVRDVACGANHTVSRPDVVAPLICPSAVEPPVGPGAEP